MILFFLGSDHHQVFFTLHFYHKQYKVHRIIRIIRIKIILTITHKFLFLKEHSNK